MKGWVVALFMLLFVGVPQLFAVGEYGNKLTRQIFAKFKGDWKCVVGVDNSYPIILLDNGEVRRISPSSSLSYQERILPVAGRVKVLDSTLRGGLGEAGFHFEFVSDKDYDDLYIGVFFQNKDRSEVTGMLVREVGNVKAGEVKKAHFTWSRRDKSGPLGNFSIVLYYKGFEIESDKSQVRQSRRKKK